MYYPDVLIPGVRKQANFVCRLLAPSERQLAAALTIAIPYVYALCPYLGKESQV